MTKVSLLSINYINGKRKLEIFEQSNNNVRAYRTDYAKICGSSDYWMAKIEKTTRPNVFKDSSDSELVCDYDDIFVGIRPIVYYNNISSKIANKYVNKDSILEIEYGEYPQTAVSIDLATELEHLYQNNKLTQGKYYTFNLSRMLDRNQFPMPRLCYSEYLFNGCKYVRVMAQSNNQGMILSNSLCITANKYYWVSVDPIKWLVDKKTGICLSKNIITTGEKPNYIYFMLKYCFDDEIKVNKSNLQNNRGIKINNIKANETTDEIALIINGINKYKKYYYGRVDIDDKITKLINEYNYKISSIAANNRIILTLENNDREILHLKLLANLNEILDALKLNYENNKVYHDILELINNCLVIIDNNNIKPNTELENDLKILTDIIIPYLGSDYYLNMLKEIFINEKNSILLSLENMTDLNAKSVFNYRTLFDYEVHLRTLLQKYIMDIYKDIIDKSVIDDIINNYKMICNNNYTESKNVIINTYLNTINDLVKDIKNRGNQIDNNKVNILLNTFEIGDLNITMLSLANIIKELYKIIYGIDDRDNELKNINKYIIDTRKIRIKTQ